MKEKYLQKKKIKIHLIKLFFELTGSFFNRKDKYKHSNPLLYRYREKY